MRSPLGGALAFSLPLASHAQPSALSPVTTPAPVVATVPGMPPVPDPTNLYSEQTAGKVAAVGRERPAARLRSAHQANDVYVIDPATLKVIDKFKVGLNPHHIVPSWDMKTLWVANTAEEHEERQRDADRPEDRQGRQGGSRSRIRTTCTSRRTASSRSSSPKPTSASTSAIRRRWRCSIKLDLPDCAGVNHADFSIDGHYAIFTCEFAKSLVKIDFVERKVLGYLKLSRGGMPQDIRISPDGKRFYVADMMADGIFVIDGESFKEIDFIKTGKGTHGLYPSRDGKKLYVANRGSNKIHGTREGPGTVSRSSTSRPARSKRTGWFQGGGSPDMGNVTADGKQLWLSARYDNVVYVFDTTTGEVKSIPVGKEPHGLTVWPQPGRYSLGHTGNMR